MSYLVMFYALWFVEDRRRMFGRSGVPISFWRLIIGYELMFLWVFICRF